MHRLLRSRSVKSLGFVVLVLVTVSAKSEATEVAVNDPFQPPFVYQRISKGVVMRSMMLENLRRAMLLQKCSAKGGGVGIAPTMLPVIAKLDAWLLHGDTSIAGEPLGFDDDMQSVLATLANARFTGAELSRWREFRQSEAGERGARVDAMLNGIDLVGRTSLVDVLNGKPWTWPLVQLRRLADDAGLRRAFDASLESFASGTASQVANMSERLVPAYDGPVDIEKLSLDLESGEFARRFVKSLTAGDRQAFDRYVEQPQLRSWQAAMQPFAQVLFAEQSAAALCMKAGVRDCGSGTALVSQVTSVQKRWLPRFQQGYPLPVLKNMVRKIPEAGCPAR